MACMFITIPCLRIIFLITTMPRHRRLRYALLIITCLFIAIPCLRYVFLITTMNGHCHPVPQIASSWRLQKSCLLYFIKRLVIGSSEKSSDVMYYCTFDILICLWNVHQTALYKLDCYYFSLELGIFFRWIDDEWSCTFWHWAASLPFDTNWTALQ